MRFINTRPQSRASNLTAFLQRHGVTVLELPLLELLKKPLNADEIATLQAIDTYQAVIMVSEEAVKYGLLHLINHQDVLVLPNRTAWVTVGEKTAEFFIKRWQAISDLPPPAIIYPQQKAEQNNEGMLALPIIQSLKTGNKVQLWRGIGGRELLADTLTANGVQVDIINFYQRTLPLSTQGKFADYQPSFDKATPTVVLISSLTAWQHWCVLVNRHQLPLNHFRYLVLQSRIASMMREQLCDDSVVMLTHDLQPSTILTHLTC